MSTAGLSRSRLGRMHDVMKGYVERGEVPGLITLVSRRGEVHINVIGTLAYEVSDPIQRDTIFRISSLTKPIIAVATLQRPDGVLVRVTQLFKVADETGLITEAELLSAQYM